MDEYTYDQLPQTVANDEIKNLNDDLDVMADEIVRLQEHIRILEQRQNVPSEGFLGQLFFDIGCAIGFVWLVVQLFGG